MCSEGGPSKRVCEMCKMNLICFSRTSASARSGTSFRTSFVLRAETSVRVYIVGLRGVSENFLLENGSFPHVRIAAT
jgi:hypothetical protein